MTGTTEQVRGADRTLAGPRRGLWRAVALSMAGLLVIQAAWSMVVPPFRGLDEHDHAYKAAAVAEGDWTAQHESSPLGWGEFVVVPRSLVVAATPVCESLPYTTEHNCRPVADVGDGLVIVASSAARYHPLFYAAVGSAASWADGTTSLYAMRFAAALLCALLLSLAVLVTARTSLTAWRGAALVLALTPTMLYTTSIAAPNGVEVAAAGLVWASVLALVALPPRARPTPYVLLAVAGAVPLVVVRSLGPLWLALILVTVAILTAAPSLRARVSDRLAWAATAVVGSAVAASVAWTLTARAVTTESIGDVFDKPLWRVVPEQWVLWFFQSVAAFPARNELAPIWLYVCVFLVLWPLVGAAWRLGSRRERWAMAAVLGLGSAVPIAVTLATYERIGTAWQGRYAYPFTMGLLLVCGLVLERRTRGRWRDTDAPLWAAAAVAMGANLAGQLTVLHQQLDSSPLAGTDAWWAPPVLLVVALNVVGFGLLAAALLPARRNAPDSLRA